MSERTFDRYVIPINVLEDVHNYCNRWCERCRFRPRCTVYVNSNPDSVEARDTVPFEPVPSPELQETLEAAGAFEEPTEAAMAEFDRRERRVRREIARQPALTLAKAYTTAAEVALGELGEAGARDAAEVVRWHQYFIWIKVHRALHGTMDEWFEPDDLEADAVRLGESRTRGHGRRDGGVAGARTAHRIGECGARGYRTAGTCAGGVGGRPPSCPRVCPPWIRHRTTLVRRRAFVIVPFRLRAKRSGETSSKLGERRRRGCGSGSQR